MTTEDGRRRPQGKGTRIRRTVSPAWIRGLSTRVVRSVLVCLACSLVFTVGVWWIGELDASADRLLRDGTRVPGYVTDVRESKNSKFLGVRYFLHGVPSRYTFRRDSDVSYVVGQPVTVVYDPADPARIRTVEEKNIGYGARTGSVATMLAGVAVTVWSAIVAVGWVVRRRWTRATGWRRASVEQPVREPRSPLTLVARFADHSELFLRPTKASLYVASQATGGRPVRAFVSGTGGAMTVLVPREGMRPWLIAVKA